jgi:L-lactate dehydrogenase
MGLTIGIVGMGWVGSSVAISLLHQGLAERLLLNDLRQEIAEGEAMDLEHGSLFYDTRVRVRSASVETLAEAADLVVLAAGRGGSAGESRLALLRDNAALARELGRSLRGYRGVVVVVTNPVDVLTSVVTEASGLPPRRVIGTGTMLDTARLRSELAGELGLHPQSVHAQVVGEHGDSSVCIWSGARAGGRVLRRWPAWSASREEEIGERVRRAAYEIIERKGATNHAIGVVTASLVRSILRNQHRVQTVSRVQEGAAGVEGVALSLPSVVDADGAATVVEPDLEPSEREALAASAEVIGAALQEARRAMDGEPAPGDPE